MDYVDDVLLSLTGDGWYDFGKLMKNAKDCRLWFVIGARRIGKTDRMLHVALELWLRYGRKTMWLRDYLTTTESKSFLADFLNDAKEFGWISDVDEKHTWVAKPDGVHDPDDNVVIKFQSLSTYSSRRGPAHPDVDLMLFDEFIPEDRRYQKGALKALMSLTKTVFSGRDGCRCICCSNYVSLSNPYFAGLEIYPEAKKDVTVWRDKGVAVERCRGYRCAIEESSPWTAVYAAARYGDYADESEDMMHTLVRRVPKGARPLDFRINIFGKWYEVFSDGRLRYGRFGTDPKRKAVSYVTRPEDISEGMTMITLEVRTMIELDLNRGLMRFESPNVLFAFVNLIYNI